jgi:hypothetical protein
MDFFGFVYFKLVVGMFVVFTACFLLLQASNDYIKGGQNCLNFSLAWNFVIHHEVLRNTVLKAYQPNTTVFY